jgi:glycosyltransferase involved in cell wall biosynthesis
VVRRVVLAAPGSLDTPTGGFAYDRRIISELRELGWSAEYLDLGAGFPFADGAARDRAESRLLEVPAGVPLVLDGLALGVLPDVAARLAKRNPLLGLVHHPLALEWGLSSEQISSLRQSERAALAHMREVVVTSATTSQLVISDYGVPSARVTVINPGNDPVSRARGSQSDALHLLSVGAVVPRKGFGMLTAAFGTLTDLPWRLTIVGDLTRDSVETAHVRSCIDSLGLSDRIAMVGAVQPERLEELYHTADVFVLASRFEGYGMAYAEALSRGLPIVGTTAGAISRTVPDGAGLLVTADDKIALAGALRAVMTDPELRDRMSSTAWAAAKTLPSWRSSGAAFARVLERFA